VHNAHALHAPLDRYRESSGYPRLPKACYAHHQLTFTRPRAGCASQAPRPSAKREAQDWAIAEHEKLYAELHGGGPAPQVASQHQPALPPPPGFANSDGEATPGSPGRFLASRFHTGPQAESSGVSFPGHGHGRTLIDSISSATDNARWVHSLVALIALHAADGSLVHSACCGWFTRSLCMLRMAHWFSLHAADGSPIHRPTCHALQPSSSFIHHACVLLHVLCVAVHGWDAWTHSTCERAVGITYWTI
jgi:hypothetical protein